MTRTMFLLGLTLLILTLATFGYAVDGLRACRRLALRERG